MDFKQLARTNRKNKFIFNNAAADRILGLPAFTVLETALVHKNKVAVKTRDGEYELPTGTFYREFARSRQQRSQKLKVSSKTGYSNVFMVTNPENHNRYPTRITATGIECKCRDYQKQQELNVSKHSCCKHAYAVLKSLGYSSLSEYLTDDRQAISA